MRICIKTIFFNGRTLSYKNIRVAFWEPAMWIACLRACAPSFLETSPPIASKRIFWFIFRLFKKWFFLLCLKKMIKLAMCVPQLQKRSINTKTLDIDQTAGSRTSELFHPSCPDRNGTKKHWIIHQKVQTSCQNFPTHLPKVLLLLTTHLSHAPKSHKKIQQAAAYLVRVTAPNFNLPSVFLKYFMTTFKWMPHYLKVQMVKRRRYGWIREDQKITAKIKCRSSYEVGAQKTTWKWNCPQNKKGVFCVK